MDRTDFGRIVAFTDGVMAVAITLLVLNLEVPDVRPDELDQALRELDGSLLAYVLTFALVGRFWVIHHNLFETLERFDSQMMVLNLLFLALIALMPFGMDLVDTYPDTSIAIATFAAILSLTSLTHWTMTTYALRSDFVHEQRVSDARRGSVIALGVPAVFLLSVPVMVLLLVVGPFLWILMSSFKTQIAILSGAWVFTPTLASYQDVLFSRRSDFVNGLYTSLVVATVSTVVVLVIGTLAAYSLYRYRWAHWVVAGLLGWMLAFHVIPVITMVGPWYLMFKELGLYDTRTALVLTHVAINLPMAVWLMMSFFRQLPPEIEEAALVDGCRPLSAFWLVTLPLVVPGLIATGVLSFIFSWNEFTVALNLTSQTNATVPVVVAKFANDYEIQHSQMAAASILATLPALLLMFFGQRFIVQGLTQGSVK